MSKTKSKKDGAIAINRRGRYDYEIVDTMEAGIVLTGSEVKALRQGHANIAESYISPENGGVWLINADIPKYAPANRFNHEPKRHRKLLLKRKQIEQLAGAVTRDGLTIIALRLYFNDRGYAKMQIGLAKGLKNIDKRENIKKREWNKQKARLMKNYG